ncbi:MAG: SAM-dependent methyltransferase [Erysipelotrichia bacterium]|nr:SAM-dependent methyltransferase [Erysipelotrichia bacterium]
MSTRPKLSKRLQALVDFVPYANVIADIGCDHAYVAISLILNQKANFAYGIDNKEEPLKVAQYNVLSYHLGSSISLLKNPLNQPIHPCDGCIIAGVGKDVAVSIIDEFEPHLQKDAYVCLQVNAQIIEMRIHMKARGYRLINEVVVYDKKYYVILLYQKGDEVYDGVQLWIGPILLSKLAQNKDYFIELKQTASHFRAIAQDQVKQSLYASIDDYLQGIL